MPRRVLEAFTEIDVREILSAVNVPTLILHRADERIARSRVRATWPSRFRRAGGSRALITELAGSPCLLG